MKAGPFHRELIAFAPSQQWRAVLDARRTGTPHREPVNPIEVLRYRLVAPK